MLSSPYYTRGNWPQGGGSGTCPSPPSQRVIRKNVNSGSWTSKLCFNLRTDLPRAIHWSGLGQRVCRTWSESRVTAAALCYPRSLSIPVELGPLCSVTQGRPTGSGMDSRLPQSKAEKMLPYLIYFWNLRSLKTSSRRDKSYERILCHCGACKGATLNSRGTPSRCLL